MSAIAKHLGLPLAAVATSCVVALAAAGNAGCPSDISSGLGRRAAEVVLLQKHHQKSSASLVAGAQEPEQDDMFAWMQGGCRTAADTTGDFHKFEADAAECRKECAENPLCVAWEHRPPLRCESHFAPIDHAESTMTTYSCWIRKRPAFERLDGACRTSAGSIGTFATISLDAAECERWCSSDCSCVAYEHGRGNRCEVHHEVITHTDSALKGFTCWIRGESSPASPAQAATPASSTVAPTASPTSSTSAPTASPTLSTVAPTASPTSSTLAPTAAPTSATPAPTASPTLSTMAPTASPTSSTLAPTAASISATPAPTQAPTSPTWAPTTPSPVADDGEQAQLGRSSDGYLLDGFGIKQLFPSGGRHRDWAAEWQTPRIGYGGVRADGNTGASFRGGSSNKFAIGGGEMTMENAGDKTNTPRYYIHQDNENVELTAYFWVAEDDYYGGSSNSKGPTLVVRSNHQAASDSTPCEARGYYLRFTPNEKTLRFLKEKYHGNGKTRYSFLRKGSRHAAFPWSQWVGLKFVARTKSNGDVVLQAYMDLSDGADGGDWKLQVEYTDSASDSEDMFGCPHASTFGEGAVAFIRADSLNPIKWKKASLREVESFPPQ